MDNVRVAEIDFAPPDADGGDQIYQHSFCLGYKARDAAEDFLLARYRLYTNVYFHKTTRGIEQMISAFFRFIAGEMAENRTIHGLSDQHPLALFFSEGGDTLVNYRAMDDTVVWGAIHSVANSGAAPASEIASRILNRERPLCIDVQNTFPEEVELQRRLKRHLDSRFRTQLGTTVFRDTANLSIYGEIGADDSRAQKRLMIQMSDQRIKEITDFKDATIARSDRHRAFERYYFLSQADFIVANSEIDSLRGRPK